VHAREVRDDAAALAATVEVRLDRWSEVPREASGRERIEQRRIGATALHARTLAPRLRRVDGLVERFLAALAPDVCASFVDASGLPERLRGKIAEARAEHPAIAIDDGAFVEAMAARVVDDLEPIRAGELLLVLGCARGDRAALATFERAFGPDVDLAIRKSPNLGIDRAEFRQLVRERLFVASGESPPRIASFSARGSLQGFVRVMAARMVIDLARKKDDHESAGDGSLLDRVAGGRDPEMAILRHAYRDRINEAFRDALGKLTVRQRNLLRQKYLHGLAAEPLAKLYGVHRATAFSWLEDTRKALLEGVRTSLSSLVPGAELESVVALLGSALHVSVGRMLESSLESEARPAAKK
jgi:RNA polymerase sigma-70 factor (ECF subfamily)